MNAPIQLATLAAAWLQAKADEDAAKTRRYEIEKKIIAAVPVKDEGTAKTEADGLRISVVTKHTRSVDTEALQTAWASLQPTVQKAFNWKADLSMSALKRLDEQETAQALRYVTTKPAKPAVKVEAIEANT